VVRGSLEPEEEDEVLEVFGFPPSKDSCLVKGLPKILLRLDITPKMAKTAAVPPSVKIKPCLVWKRNLNADVGPFLNAAVKLSKNP